MNNGKYDTESFKTKQADRLNKKYGPVTDHKKVCQRCGKEYVWAGRKGTTAFTKSKFCSRSCANNRQTVWDAKIQTGESSGEWAQYRKTAIANHGERCVVCGFDKIVDVHHLDHNRDNNSKENLVPLCPNHHMMIHRSKYAEEVLQEIQKYINGLLV